MPIHLPDARQLSDEALQVLRLRALRGIELGYSEVELAQLLGVCHETISRWWTAYATRRPNTFRSRSTTMPRSSSAFRTLCGHGGLYATSSVRSAASTWPSEPLVSTCVAGATRPRSRNATHASKT